MKLNRTLFFQESEATTSAVTSTVNPTTTSEWLNRTTNSILTTASAIWINFTSVVFEDSSNYTTSPTKTFDETTASEKSEFTTASIFDELSGEHPDESQDDELSRRKRSMEGKEVEAAFEEVTASAVDEFSTGTPDYYQNVDMASFPEYFADFRARHLNFKDFGDSPISEAVEPDER